MKINNFILISDGKLLFKTLLNSLSTFTDNVIATEVRPAKVLTHNRAPTISELLS